LLWSVKPGVVQEWDADWPTSAGDFARRELRAEQAANLLTTPTPPKSKRNWKRNSSPCAMSSSSRPPAHPPRRSGGPLLELAEGGLSASPLMATRKSWRGPLLHPASEIRSFSRTCPPVLSKRCPLSGKPRHPVPHCRSGHQRPARNRHSKPDGTGARRCADQRFGRLGWDLAESSDLKPLQHTTPKGTPWM